MLYVGAVIWGGGSFFVVREWREAKCKKVLREESCEGANNVGAVGSLEPGDTAVLMQFVV